MKNILSTFFAIQGESIDFDSLVALNADVCIDDIGTEKVEEATADMIGFLDFIEVPKSDLTDMLSEEEDIQSDAISRISNYVCNHEVIQDGIDSILEEYKNIDSNLLEVMLDNAGGCDYGYKLKTVTKDGKPVKRCVRQKYAPRKILSSAQKAHLRSMHKKKRTHSQIMQQQQSLRKTLARKGISMTNKDR